MKRRMTNARIPAAVRPAGTGDRTLTEARARIAAGGRVHSVYCSNSPNTDQRMLSIESGTRVTRSATVRWVLIERSYEARA